MIELNEIKSHSSVDQYRTKGDEEMDRKRLSNITISKNYRY